MLQWGRGNLPRITLDADILSRMLLALQWGRGNLPRITAEHYL